MPIVTMSADNHLEAVTMKPKVFYGWRVVAACFIIACFAWGLGLFGSSVYLQAVTAAHGWSIAQVSSAITVFLFVSAAGQRTIGRSIARHGPRPALLLGTVSMCIGVVSIGQVDRSWQLYPCFALLGVGWATLSTTGISATVAPWFERHQGRSITLAIMGASFGAILGVPLLLYLIDRWGLRGGLLAVGIGAATVLLPLIASVLRYRAPEELGMARDGDRVRRDDTTIVAATHIATPENRRRLLWSTTAAFALTLLAQIGFIAHHVALGEPFLGKFGAGLLVSATGVVTLFGRMYLAKRPGAQNGRARHQIDEGAGRKPSWNTWIRVGGSASRTREGKVQSGEETLRSAWIFARRVHGRFGRHRLRL
jgi:MFS family permease